MVHFAIVDASGRAVAVEYIDNAMSVVETPVVTNFYLTEGEKYGVETEESRLRYQILTERLSEKSAMEMDDVRDALDAVSKHNFNSVFASTEWSVVYDQTNGEARYYHREDYSRFFPFSVRQAHGKLLAQGPAGGAGVRRSGGSRSCFIDNGW